jgi:hypothetical protein
MTAVDLSPEAEAWLEGREPSLLRCLADIEARPVDWLWPRRIPKGMPSVIFGPTGLGKSHVYLDVVTRVSLGIAYPDGGRAPLGNCVILSAEDDPETVIKPRLTYSGADLTRIHSFPSVLLDEIKKKTFSFLDDAARFEREILNVEAVLAVVDPVTAYLRGVDSHVVAEVREALAVIDDIARRTGAAIVCIAHPNKSGGAQSTAIQRLSGSGAFGDAPRSVMVVVSDPDDETEERRLLLPVKLNIARRPEGIGFHITAASPDTCESGIAWDGDPVTVDADEVLGARRVDSPEVQRAKDFLLGAMADGEWHAARDLRDEAGTRHIHEKTLERGRKRLGVERQGRGFPATSWWRLPGAASQ